MDEVSGWPSVEDVAWIDIDDPSAASAVRRAAEALAERLGMAAGRVADVGLAVTEIATNVRLHAGGGAVLLRALRPPLGQASLEVVAVDAGPGIADLPTARQDGRSTSGTLGIGLGAIHRLADSLDIASEHGRGTVVLARFSQDRHASPPVSPPGTDADGITRALAGEDTCGDAYAVRRHGAVVSLMLCDGSGHGPMAAAAAQEAVRVFIDPAHAVAPPDAVVRRVHAALLGTRGGAVAVAELDTEHATLTYAGVGNISGSIVDDGQRRRMVSIGGVAGYLDPTIRSFTYPLPPTAVVVLHSDGVRPRWDVPTSRLMRESRPLLIAAGLLRDAGVPHDDACVLVARAGAR